MPELWVFLLYRFLHLLTEWFVSLLAFVYRPLFYDRALWYQRCSCSVQLYREKWLHTFHFCVALRLIFIIIKRHYHHYPLKPNLYSVTSLSEQVHTAVQWNYKLRWSFNTHTTGLEQLWPEWSVDFAGRITSKCKMTWLGTLKRKMILRGVTRHKLRQN